MKSPGEQTAFAKWHQLMIGMYLGADRCKHHCVCPRFESPELSAEKLPPNTPGKPEEGNWEDMGCGVDELLSYNRCAIQRD